MSQTPGPQSQNTTWSTRKAKVNYSSSFKVSGRKSHNQDVTVANFKRSDSLRHSTGSIKGKKMERVAATPTNGHRSDESDGPVSPSVSNLIKGFQSKIVNGTDTTDFATPGYVAESPTPGHRKINSKRKISLLNTQKKGKMSTDDARYSILQSLGVSPFAGQENRGLEKSYGYFDIQSLFFDLTNASTLKSTYEEGGSYSKKLTGASAAHVRSRQSRRKTQSGQFDPETGTFRSKVDSMIDDGDDKENELILSCPYFRNEIAESEETSASEAKSNHTKNIAKLISMFNRNRSFENLRNGSWEGGYSKRRRHLDSSEQNIFLEELKEGSHFFAWDEPNVNGKQIFDFEHIDRGSLYYREYFHEKENLVNLFGVDEKYGPIGISIIREILPRMAVGGPNDNEKNKKYQYRIILRTCELYALRISVLENSIPSTSRHGSSRPLPLKDILEFCFPEVQLSCLKHALAIPKIGEQLLKLDEQQLSLTFKIGLLYCKAGQETEEDMYNNERGGSEFMEFCSVIADKVTLKGFTGYRAQLDNKNDSTGQYSLYTTFHGREIMFHVSTELPYTVHDRQQVLRKRHIGNDIVTVIFQEEGSVPFTPKMMRSHFQHVFIIVRVENAHSEDTRYSIAVSRSSDVPFFGPPIPPNKFYKNGAFREFLLSKIINAEHAAHKSEKFTHMARRTRYEYLKDLATNQVSTQTLETSNKFAFPFTGKKKEKTHPPVSPEIWLLGGIVWSIKYDFEHDGPGLSAFLSISSKCVTFIEQNSQEVLLSVPCKTILGWRPTSHTLKIFYDVGKMAFFTMTDDDHNELPYVMNRLKAVTTGCETQDLTLKRNNDGQLGFHVFYEGLVAEVEPYGLAWQSGLRKGSRLLEISGHTVGTMSHDRMILMLKRPGAVRLVVLPPALDGQPRNFKAVCTMRRYSSMTSIYSMSTSNCHIGDDNDADDDGDSDGEALLHSSSSKEYITPSTDEGGFINSKMPTENRQSKQKIRSLSHEEQPFRKESFSTSYTSDTSTEPTPTKPIKTTAQPTNSYSRSHQERLLTSRSASDICEVNHVSFASEINKPPEKQFSPTGSFDHELGELERQLTDTRKSIDAKFYKSLANSSSPFFRSAKPDSPLSPTKEKLFPLATQKPQDSENDAQHSGVYRIRKTNIYTGRSSDSQVSDKNYSSSEGTESTIKSTFEPLKFKDTSHVMLRNDSLQNAMEQPRKMEESSSVFITPSTPTKLQKLRKVDPITFEIHAKGGQVMQLKQMDKEEKPPITRSSENVGNISDSSSGLDKKKRSSHEGLISDSDVPNRKGSLVKTKVRDASDIIHERSYGRDSPVSRDFFNRKSQSIDHSSSNTNPEHAKLGQRFSYQPQKITMTSTTAKDLEKTKTKAMHLSPKSSPRNTALVKALGSAARNKAMKENTPNQGQKIRSKIILDDSLTDTFAKLESAFAMKPSPSPDTTAREEKRKRRHKHKRRSRNYEPPSSDSSYDDDSSPDTRRRGGGLRIQLKKNDDPETSSLTSKSEAEQSLEAAISDFHMSLSTMPDKKDDLKASKNSASIYSSSDQNESSEPPKIPIRSSRPPHARYSQTRETRSKSQDLSSNRRQLTGLACTRSTDNVENNARRRSEAKISLRPWSPPLNKVEPSASILQNVINSKPKPLVIQNKKEPQTTEEVVEVEEHIVTETCIEDQLSPLPGIPPRPLSRGTSRCTNSLPGRSHKRRKSAQAMGQQHLRSKSTSCIPLQVRGLDLAASCSDSSIASTKEDLQTMIAVMEDELEKERIEKEALRKELSKSQKEKEAILEQSKQAASQLRKFTSLFLDASPKEIEKAKKKYNESR